MSKLFLIIITWIYTSVLLADTSHGEHNLTMGNYIQKDTKKDANMNIQVIDVQTKIDRNFAILNAYLDGYSQVDIASYLQVSKSLISKVVNSKDSLTGM